MLNKCLWSAPKCNPKCTERCNCPTTTIRPTTQSTRTSSASAASATTRVTTTPTSTQATTTSGTTTTTSTTKQTPTTAWPTTTSASSPRSTGQGTTNGLTASPGGPTSANPDDDTTVANAAGSAGASGKGDDPPNLPVIITVVIAGIIVVAVVLVAVFLLRRKGVICNKEPEEGLPEKKSTDVKDPRNKNRYSDIPSASVLTNSQATHDSGSRSSNGAAKPPGLPAKTGSGVENSSTGAKTPAVYLTLEPETSRLTPSAPVYFTVDGDSASALPRNVSRDNSTPSHVGDEANVDDVYHEIDDRDVRGEETDDEYNKLGEKKTTTTETQSGSVYGHLQSSDVDYDHVTKGKKSDVRVRHNDYDVAPAARVDSGDYNHVTRDVRSDVTVVGSDYDVARPRKQSVSKDEGDYDHPPPPKKVKDAKGNGAPTGSGQKGADGAGSYELAGPLPPKTAGSAAASMAVSSGSPGSEGLPEEPDIEAKDPNTCGSPYAMASAGI